MAGKSQVRRFVVPPGEGQRLYEPTEVGYSVKNLQPTEDGGMRSVDGPCLYENSNVGVFDKQPTFGLCHAALLGGIADTLLVRHGLNLYRHEGANQTFRTLQQAPSDLSYTERPRFPDQWSVLADKVIWTNGIDQAQVIRFDDTVTPLGMWEVPAAPHVMGPARGLGNDDEDMHVMGAFATPPIVTSPATSGSPILQHLTQFPNTQGYAWPGHIGTPGDAFQGRSGSVLQGAFMWREIQMDDNGNLSAPSAPSNVAMINAAQADPTILGGADDNGAEISDLQRQFAVSLQGDAPDHVVARLLYRSLDLNNEGRAMRLVARIPGNRGVLYPDNVGALALGGEMPDTVPVPVFRVMTTHNSRLVIANLVGDPGRVMWSEPGLGGTFLASNFAYPDDAGSEVTGLVSHAGILLAGTIGNLYSMEDPHTPKPLAKGIGIIGPRTIGVTGSGVLVWLGADRRFYALPPEQLARPEPISDPITRRTRHFLNPSRLHMAVCATDPETGDYVIAVPPAGETKNSLLLRYNGGAWREESLGISFTDLCAVYAGRNLLLGVGTDGETVDIPGQGSQPRSRVFVLGREDAGYTPPARSAVFQSRWLLGDEQGMQPVFVSRLAIGLRDAYDGPITVSFAMNGVWEFGQEQSVTAVGPTTGGLDRKTNVLNDIMGTARAGSARVRTPRLYWRWVPVNLVDAYSWAFKLEMPHPGRMHIEAFLFEVSVPEGGKRSELPLGRMLKGTSR